MGGVYGVQEFKEVAKSVAQAANAVSKLLNKGGLLSLLGLVEPLNALKGVDFAVLKQELGELDAADRAAVEAEFAANLSLHDPAVQAKILAGVGVLDEGIELVGRAVKLVNDSVDLVNKAKALVGA